MNSNRFYVYLYHRLDGTPCYVGKGSGDRAKGHPKKNSNPHLVAIIKQAESQNVILPFEIVSNGLTELEAFDLECELIKKIGRETNGGTLVNLTDGGEGTSGWVATAEFKEKRRRIMLDYFEQNPLARAAASARAKGNRHNMNAPRTEVWSQNISKSLLGNTRTKGHQLSDDHKRKIGDGVRGIKQSPEWIANRIAKAAATRRKRNAERKTA